MKPAEFSAMLCEWRARCAWSDAQAAAELGCAYGTLRHWLTARTVPGYFAMCAVVRQMREGHDPLTDVQMTHAEFARALKEWRVQHRLSQRQAAVAIGTTTDVVRDWESKDGAPRQPALGEILRRLRMPVDGELVRQATKRPRPIEPEKFAGLMRAWRRRCKLSRVEAAYALRSTGLNTTDRTIWTWESAAVLPQRPLAVLELIHGSLAVNPPKPKPLITTRQFATLLKSWRRQYCLTQMQACAALGLKPDQAVISDWERGVCLPQKRRLQRMIEALQTAPPTGRGSHNWFAGHAVEFGKRLRAWRKARGITQPEACTVLGLGRCAAISHYERGKTSPRGARLKQLLAIIEGTEVQP